MVIFCLSSRCSRCEGADSYRCEARWSSAPSCWTDNSAVWAAGLQAGWPENVAGILIWHECVCLYCFTFLTVAACVVKVSDDLLSQHYCELRTKPFYPRLQEYMTSGPVVVMVRALLFAFQWDTAVSYNSSASLLSYILLFIRLHTLKVCFRSWLIENHVYCVHNISYFSVEYLVVCACCFTVV